MPFTYIKIARVANVSKIEKVPRSQQSKVSKGSKDTLGQKVYSGTGSSHELFSRSSSTLKKVHLVYFPVDSVEQKV